MLLRSDEIGAVIQHALCPRCRMGKELRPNGGR
jgi:hypothetical protein